MKQTKPRHRRLLSTFLFALPLILPPILLATPATAQEPNVDTTDKADLVNQQTENKFVIENPNGESTTIGYLLFHPKAYDQGGEEKGSEEKAGNPQVAKKWPLLVFLHGAGERGDDLDKVRQWGPPKRVATDHDFPFVVLSPQCPAGIYWNIDHVNQLIDKVIAENQIDTNQVYVTGLSMGGFGTWSLVAAHPEKFAAAIPICGGGDPANAQALSQTPIWAFHGDQDNTVPVKRTTDMVDAIKEIDGKNIKLTLYPGVHHNSWSATYANPEIYKWLLSNKRTKK